MESWQEIVGYPNYKISDLGRVKSVIRGGEKILKPSLGSKGYYHVYLHNNEGRKYCSLHRLIATVFIPNPDNHPQVNHINGDKLDNNITNLQWVTASENIRHSFGTGLHSGKGEKHYRHKSQIYKFFNPKLGTFEECTQYEFREKYNIDKGNLYHLIKGNLKSCKGWILAK